MKKGVYFLANDQVLSWSTAFLNSLRRFNPDLPLYLIPFNEQCDQLLKLQPAYNFKVYDDHHFQRLEKIGRAFELGHQDYSHSWFRRYASFWGPLDEFLYLDTRTLVLQDLEPIISAPRKNGFEFLHYDCALDQVYEPGPFRRQLLLEGRARGFLSGMWASVKGLFTIEEFEQLAHGALKIRDQLNARNTDQAFINYCCDVRKVKYGHFAEVLGGYCHSGWARQSGRVYEENGKYYLWDHGGLDHKKQLFVMHWGGVKLSPVMPERLLFLKYYGKINWASSVKDLLQYPRHYIYQLIRKSRVINSTYHKWRKSNITNL